MPYGFLFIFTNRWREIIDLPIQGCQRWYGSYIERKKKTSSGTSPMSENLFWILWVEFDILRIFDNIKVCTIGRNRNTTKSKKGVILQNFYMCMFFLALKFNHHSVAIAPKHEYSLCFAYYSDPYSSYLWQIVVVNWWLWLNNEFSYPVLTFKSLFFRSSLDGKQKS